MVDSVVLPRKLVAGIQTANLSTGIGQDVPLADNSATVFNASIQAVRTQPNVFAALRLLRRISGDTSTAIASFVRLANTDLNYKVYSADHQLSDEGSVLIKSVINNLENLNDYTYGFDNRQSMRGLVDTLLNEVLLTGATAAELVLDKVRLPFMLQPVSPATLKWKTTSQTTGKETTKIIPWQSTAKGNVDLDFPTFFYAALDADPTAVFPKPPLEAGVNAAVFHAETVEDIRRTVKRSGHSRLMLTLITEELLKAAPMEIRMDAEKLATWMEGVRADVAAQVEALSPESALVLFDTLKAEYLTSEIGASADYTPLMGVVDGIEATALRTPPAVLGKRLSGSQNVSSTESLLFLHHAAGIQTPVQTVLSKALTLALRLYGFDGYVQAQFAAINLRPKDELAAFRAMDQARILELLSLGFITDQEAGEWLGTGLRAPGAPPLSGTFFYKSNTALDPVSMDNAAASSGDPGQQAVSGNPVPKKAGGRSQ